MPTARQKLVEDLRANLPDTYRITGPLALGSGITRPTVAVFQQIVSRTGEVDLPAHMATVGLELWLLTTHEDVEKADDTLDEALDDLILALKPIKWVHWSEARRGVLYDAFHGYQITATAVATIGE